MNFTIRNVGNIKDITLELKGITCITGYSDTGKSNICKAFYAISRGLYKAFKVHEGAHLLDLMHLQLSEVFNSQYRYQHDCLDYELTLIEETTHANFSMQLINDTVTFTGDPLIGITEPVYFSGLGSIESIISTDCGGGFTYSTDIQTALDKLSKIATGDLVAFPSGLVAYREMNQPSPLHIKNISKSVRKFVILKTLLTKGYLIAGSILIIDDAERYLHRDLHPLFIEVIVLIQKALSLQIMITTTSESILEALDTYTKEYNTCDGYSLYNMEDVLTHKLKKHIHEESQLGLF